VDVPVLAVVEGGAMVHLLFPKVKGGL
jgi:hypothetical protein